MSLLPVAVVIPSLGRPSLAVLLRSLADQDLPPDLELHDVIVVDDRPPGGAPLAPEGSGRWTPRVVRGLGRGPAAARNLGWRVARAPWIAFLDDDVVLPAGWAEGLARDLRGLGPRVAGSQGRLRVPLPPDRRPTDWERNTAGLEQARWATADLAYRRVALEAVGGFDERFPRAYREDADLALRLRRAGWRLVRGDRSTLHPVRPADDWVSLRVQRGNADDALMRRLHGRGWREEAEVFSGRLPGHVATVAAGVVAAGAAALGRPRLALAAATAWAGLTADFARRRIAPGPGPGEPGWAAEWRRMLLTSAAIPPAAVVHRLRGAWQHRAAAPWPLPVRAVLFDRDGTLVHDVPYNGDPAKVRPVDDAAAAVAEARDAGLLLGVVSNQSGIGRGLITAGQAEAVNAEIDRRLGPFGTWQYCPHTEADGCACRKPGPELVRRAAAALGVPVEQCVVIGDIGADVEAARAAGATGILVPTATTRPEEVAAAPLVADGLLAAVRAVRP